MDKRSKILVTALIALYGLGGRASAAATTSKLTLLEQPIIKHGDAHTAYRDPLLYYKDGTFHLYFSLVREEEDHLIYWYVAESTTKDFRTWTADRLLTAKDQNKNFSSPGSIVETGDGRYLLTMQTYPIVGARRGDPLRFTDERARLFTMQSSDLDHWDGLQLLRVKGPSVDEPAMGRMIDAYIFPDKDRSGQWWCLYKQKGKILSSRSADLRQWETTDVVLAEGENPCILVEGGEYVLFYAPANGIGVKRSRDLRTWREEGTPITLGQKDWPWAEARLTAGYVADFRQVPEIGKYIMVCHSMGPGKQKTDANTNAGCSIVIAWSDDLKAWSWPGKGR